MNFAELCSGVLWKVELMNDRARYLAKEISSKVSKEKQRVRFVSPDCL
jgi:hypothetical protein